MVYKLYQRSLGYYEHNVIRYVRTGLCGHAPWRLRKGLCGHAPSDHREQIVELFENTACDCYFYLRYNNAT